MRCAKAVIFVVGLALVAVGGYLPWHYADQHEVLRVDFSPIFAKEFYTPLGLLLKTISVTTWVGGVVVLRYLVYSLWRKTVNPSFRDWHRAGSKTSCRPNWPG